MDGCSRTGVLFDDVVASCELVNSSNVQMQVTGVVPIVAVDKCDGVQVRSSLLKPYLAWLWSYNLRLDSVFHCAVLVLVLAFST